MHIFSHTGWIHAAHDRGIHGQRQVQEWYQGKPLCCDFLSHSGNIKMVNILPCRQPFNYTKRRRDFFLEVKNVPWQKQKYDSGVVFLQRFIRSHLYSTVVTPDLWKALQEVTQNSNSSFTFGNVTETGNWQLAADLSLDVCVCARIPIMPFLSSLP